MALATVCVAAIFDGSRTALPARKAEKAAGLRFLNPHPPARIVRQRTDLAAVAVNSVSNCDDRPAFPDRRQLIHKI
jgi:hypothetical protein